MKNPNPYLEAQRRAGQAATDHMNSLKGFSTGSIVGDRAWNNDAVNIWIETFKRQVKNENTL